ncbi:hypothetical protein Desor_2108 [Desulfosporosinus orientis DSM 765]|uniref:Uncharacterized protein n=1 Tax=Desulfosporosinus orientis (strain ATCC 19365 / DSM 765 / NCIMB 8382 / VKM B-1628 / Singapore I) TaxID=768706 RepID=G7W654_DESOD|nr:hypothetical protein [Desulfosporosinus orientis]AET67716.1 hypothetical protein Desor_2108 [Desulfosporosinus orientis DSM 765]
MLTTFDSAVVTVEDKTIAVVSVKPGVFQNSFNASMVIKGLLPAFPGMPVMLMTIDPKGNPAFFGRSDLILLLESIDIKQASWKEVKADIDLTNSCPMKEDEQ